MAYTKLLSHKDIVVAATALVEDSNAGGLSLRAVAAVLGVKAPSLYRYFEDKKALESAVVEEAVRAMFDELQSTTMIRSPEKKFRATADAYLRFANERFLLYTFLMERIPLANDFDISKALWKLLLDAASGISGRADDTAAAVATWSLLHGYAVLRHAGGFGVSGPKGGLERGLRAFINDFCHNGPTVRTAKTI